MLHYWNPDHQWKSVPQSDLADLNSGNLDIWHLSHQGAVSFFLLFPVAEKQLGEGRERQELGARRSKLKKKKEKEKAEEEDSLTRMGTTFKRSQPIMRKMGDRGIHLQVQNYNKQMNNAETQEKFLPTYFLIRGSFQTSYYILTENSIFKGLLTE